MEAGTYRQMRELEESHWWFVARRSIIQAVVRRLGLPRNPRLLEVGCGTGGNISMLSGLGALTCVEHDPEAAELARERAAVTVHRGSLPDALPRFENAFDLVLALDVIEHVDEDEASVRSMAALLEPGGRLLVTVPAFNFLWSQHDVENEHRRRYRKRDFHRLAAANGLRIDYMTYFNFWLFPPVAAVRVVRKFIPYRETWQDMRQPGRLVNAALRGIFGSERLAAGRVSLPFGISLLGVFSRQP